MKVKDMEEVQPYLVNNEMVLFLTTRPQMGKGKAGEYQCTDCNRALLHEAYIFCSLGCMVYCYVTSLSCSWRFVNHQGCLH
jgi:hypothetical protein